MAEVKTLEDQSECARFELRPPDALELVCDADAMEAVFAAQRYERIEDFHRDALLQAGAAGRSLRDVVERGIRLELAAAMRITEHLAGVYLEVAEALVHRYPSALRSLGGAHMTERHARVLVEVLDGASDAARSALAQESVELAETQPVGVFRRMLRDRVAAIDAPTLEERHTAAVARRRVGIEVVDDGMLWLNALLPAAEGYAVWARLTAQASAIRQAPGEERTLDQIRSDVLVDTLLHARVPDQPEAVQAIRPHVVVTVPALALLGVEGGAMPVVEGLGPIPLSVARRLAGAATEWTRVLTHPETGAVLSVGRQKYRPPAELRRLVQWRADRCMAPGCQIPAGRCEIDHAIAWEDGGETSAMNLGPLCTGHHKVKHDGGWTLHPPDGSGAARWTSPAGRGYVVEPRRRMPVFVAEAPGPPPF